MKNFPKVLLIILLIIPYSFGQNPNQDSPVTIVESNWQRARKPQQKPDNEAVGPVRLMTADDKNFQRTAREQQSKGAIDPRETTVDGRRAALEKVVQDSRTPKQDDSNGYFYFAKVKNDGSKKIEVIFWEYRFTELENPLNIVRRQFLCAAKLKPGEKFDLSAFSMLGPSDVIAAESLAKTTEKIFDEKVIVNRIEYSDGSLVQRRDWKYDDVSKAVDRVTSTSWGREVCRSI